MVDSFSVESAVDDLFPDQARIKQQNITPGSIQTRSLGNIILSGSTVTSTTTLNNNQQVVYTITTSTKNPNAKTFVVPDITIYQGSVANANSIPDGANVTATNYQIIFMGNDWGQTNNINTVTKVYVRNISAGTQTIILKLISRVITNINL